MNTSATSSGRMLSPSRVFGTRLRETRRARGMSQAELAERLTAAGRPIGRPALLRIEKGTRGVSLDEALALAECLAAAPANLLSPPAGSWLALTDNVGVDDEGLRNWLMTGDALNTWPVTPRTEDAAAFEAKLTKSLARSAQALVDAIRASDAAGRAPSGRALEEAVDRQREALAALTTAEPRRETPRSYNVGDEVIYPNHGAGTIIRKESRGPRGQEREYLTIEILHNETTVEVPSEDAEALGLRPFVTEEGARPKRGSHA